MFEKYCSDKGYTFRIPIAEVYDFNVLEYSFALWQWGPPVNKIPETDEMCIRDRSVFFYRSIFITQRVDTRDTDIKHLHIVLVQIEVSFTIQNINLSPQQQLHPIHPAGNHMQVSKINRMASTGN